MWFRQCEFLGAVRLLLLPSCEIVAPSVLEVVARLQVVACEMRRERKIGARRNAPMHDGCAVLCTVERRAK